MKNIGNQRVRPEIIQIGPTVDLLIFVCLNFHFSAVALYYHNNSRGS